MSNEPQSIVHQVKRLGKLVQYFGKDNRRRRQSATRSKRNSLKSGEDSESTASLSDNSGLFHLPFDDRVNASMLDGDEGETSDPDYTTVNQIEFMETCLVYATKECYIVHFYIEGCEVSQQLDEQLEELSRHFEDSTFLRIDANYAPFVAMKMQISDSKPTLVVINQGELVSTMSDFSSKNQEEDLRKWIGKSELEAESRNLWSPREAPLDKRYRTVDQNELLTDCLTNYKPGECFIVHFFVEGSSLSETLDDQMEDFSEAGHCTFLRVNARLSPFITSRLNIKSNEPTVVAVRNGTVFGHLGELMKGMWEIERVGLSDL